VAMPDPFANVLVTGATGNVGAAVIDVLVRNNIGVTAAVMDTEAYDNATNTSVVSVRLDFHDPSSFGPALNGIDSVFLMRPPAISQVKPTLNRFITEAASRGVKHIVFLSVLGAQTNRIVPHHRVELHLAQTAVHSTILRPSFFANNLGGAYREDIRADNRLFVPAGSGRVAFIDARDIAAVVGLVAQNPADHVGRGYTLTGSATYSFAEVAALLTSRLGRSIRYSPASILGYAKHLRQQKLVMPQVLVQTILHVGLRKGSAAMVDPTLRQLLGRDSLTMSEYIEANIDLWTVALSA
jgi:uncharacterized protein YbjT (DUF2867 family)